MNGVMTVVSNGPTIFLFPGENWEISAIVKNTPNDSYYIVLMSILSLLKTASHLAMTWSLVSAPYSTTAPLQYLEIPIAAGIG